MILDDLPAQPWVLQPDGPGTFRMLSGPDQTGACSLLATRIDSAAAARVGALLCASVPLFVAAGVAIKALQDGIAAHGDVLGFGRALGLLSAAREGAEALAQVSR